ncbi:dihydromonapterin reductase [Pseudoalteromonas sp. S16_S37]|uniref:dihydromonapterin reductase n=1 Tax=Pseudoalteromonas sp. S16_S37 TaxID=2720228 RepID=UPI00168096C1|nr:dihydromonapterin reductase [Pseudoalteromonas sp. S16_S37]MBD1582714.1 dihydromonapterin reductase [Pseudoalteromonas sp. S16_S37]
MTAPILITGAGQRIGLAIAQHFVATGQPVVITYRTRHSVIDELEQSGVHCINVDFDNAQAVEQLQYTLRAHYGSLRAVIHNASSWDCEANNPDFDSLFDNMMRVHAKVPYQLNLALADLLLASPLTTDIIHLTDYVVETGSPKHIAYAASKAALDNLTRSFATKFAPKIKVNSIAPSLIIFNQHDTPEYKEKTLQKSLMGIEPGCKEIINSVELLLNSDYITGRTIPVDGGRHLK